MSWKFVFNTNWKWRGHIDEGNKAAKDCGYKFFNWNGWIYTVDGEKTDIREEDCF
jgi:hypothetical protein